MNKTLKFNRRVKVFILIGLLVVLVIKSCRYRLNYTQRNMKNNVNLAHLNTLYSDLEYLVDSPNCKIPNLNPFDESISKFLKSGDHTKCSSRPPLTEVRYSPTTGQHMLEINLAAVHFYSDGRDLLCCVSMIQPYGVNIKVTECKFFNGSWALTRDHQFLFVRCSDLGQPPVYENVHATPVRIRKTKKYSMLSEDNVNVLLLGFDSMSRLNLYRTMPKTVNYLHAQGWTEMVGYNKVGDNTLPNLMSLLTGLPLPRTQAAYLNYFDKFPFVWKDFSSAGYVTAYAEDKPYLETFYGDLPGFKNAPTDYYTRSFFLFGEKYFVNNDTGTECLGFKSPSEHMFNYLIDFVTVNKDDPFFGFFWINQFSHNDLNKPASEDKNTLKLLQQLNSQGIMGNTIVIFLSDHGLRVDDLRKTKVGWYEDRLPFLFIALPKWYKARYELRYRNLQENAKKLVSPYDLYSTIYHILQKDTWRTPSGCKTCKSLFTPVSSTRTCAEAGISPHWCSCHPINEVSDILFASFLADLVVETINAKLLDYKRIVENFKCNRTVNFSCATLANSKILYLWQKAKPSDVEYIVGVETQPGGAQFEGTIIGTRNDILVDNAMSRLNHFHNLSHCALFPESKKYCFCIDNGPSLFN
ncbi:hypothetical protein J6590_102914 [Homalodisca vitripennis]|nr:hypothetical protein J6590_102914 [Homalodisca vitripennis]